MIETERLRIRKFIPTDITQLYKLLSNSDVMRFSVAGPMTLEQTKKFVEDTIKSYDKSQLAMWAVELKENSILIGITGFFTVNTQQGLEHEIGYRFLPEYQGQGFATEAANAVKQFAFDKIKIRKFLAFIVPENVVSIKVAEKIGMRYVRDETYKGIPAQVYEVESSTLRKVELEPVNTWAEKSLENNGYVVESAAETTLTTPWSKIIRYKTNSGYVYLKQIPVEFSLEPKILKILYDEYNAKVPKVIEANHDLSCFLMQDAGTRLRDILSKKFTINPLIDAIKEYRHIQNSCLPDIKQLLELGVSDWRIRQFPILYAELINKEKILLSDGVTEYELENLNKLSSQVKLTCELLEKYPIPETLNLHDFHDGNILIDKNNNCTIIDWGESEITHPFFSLISCLKNLKFRYKLDDKILQKLQTSYFEDKSHIPEKHLEDVFNMVARIQPIYRALGFYRVKMCCDPKGFEAWDEGRGCLARPLRELIANLKTD